MVPLLLVVAVPLLGVVGEVFEVPKMDRDKITDKAKEAIARGMTYAQIDDFFKASLSPEVYQELAAHPRLTKDFLRSIKKKF